MTAQAVDIRLGADIGGTFTDIALDCRGRIFSTKVLTNYAAPEQAILDGIDDRARATPGIRLADLDIVIHGTTLATNALIERRGAKTALVTTEGFRDVIEMRTENRFEQYDLNLQPADAADPARGPLHGARAGSAPRGRNSSRSTRRRSKQIADRIAAGGFGAVAIGFIHSYMNPAHERRAREILAGKAARADLDLVRGLAADARVRAVQHRLRQRLCAAADGGLPVPPAGAAQGDGRGLPGLHDPLGRRTDLGGNGCRSFRYGWSSRVRLAAQSSPPTSRAASGWTRCVSYDMGGTTAKICLIEDFAPKTARTFEVARTYRFCKGSGMPISIPVIEMIEIGAGGGSIAWVDAMGRIQTGPEMRRHRSRVRPATSAAAMRPAITDADLVLGKLDPDNFAGGAIKLSVARSAEAIDARCRHAADARQRSRPPSASARSSTRTWPMLPASTRSRTARTSPTTS